MASCLYPGCSSQHGPEYPFCVKHWFIATTSSQEFLLAQIKKSKELDYRKVHDKFHRALQRTTTINIVDEMLRNTGGFRRTNPYKSIR